MPKRTKGKKKKCKVVQEVVQKSFKKQMDEKLKEMGLGGLDQLINKTPAQSTLDNSSVLDQSQYSYYSESMNQSAMMNSSQMQDSSHMESPDVQNIKAEIEAADKAELLQRQNKVSQSLTHRNDSKKVDFRIEDVDDSKKEDSAQMSAKTTQDTAREELKQPEETKKANLTARNGKKSQAQIEVFDEASADSASLARKSDKAASDNKLEQKESIEQPVSDQAQNEGKQSATRETKNQQKSKKNAKSKKEKAAAQEESKQEPESSQAVESRKEAVQDEEVIEGKFFDDFEAAFGSENDVPLAAPKEESQPAQVVETPAEEKKEVPVQPSEESKVEELPAEPQPETAGQGDFFEQFDDAFGGDELEYGEQTAQSDAPVKMEKPETVQSKVEVEPPVEQPVTLEQQQQSQVEPQASEPEQPKAEEPELVKEPVNESPQPSSEKTLHASMMLGPRLTQDENVSKKVEFEPAQDFQIKPVQMQAPVEPLPAKDLTLTTPRQTEEPLARPPEPVMIDTSDKGKGSAIQESIQQVRQELEETKTEQEVIEQERLEVEPTEADEDDEKDPEQPSGGSKLFLFGMACCAAAAGTWIYMKKNNIQLDEVVGMVKERFLKK